MESGRKYIKYSSLWLLVVLLSLSLNVKAQDFVQDSFTDEIFEQESFTSDLLIEDIEFSDQKLARCINRKAIKKGLKFASEITTLRCKRKGIRSLQGIQNLHKLKKVNLANNKLSSGFAMLPQNLPELQLLILNNNKVSCSELDELRSVFGEEAIRSNRCIEDTEFATQ